MQIQHDPHLQEFYTVVEGEKVYTAYRKQEGNGVNFYTTYTPPALRGQGLAKAVVKAALQWAAAQGHDVRASCWYVAQYL